MSNCSICEKAKINYAVLIDFIMEKFQKFNIWDFAVFKSCVISFGLILGSHFSKTFKKFTPILIVVALASYSYIIYKIFFKKD